MHKFRNIIYQLPRLTYFFTVDTHVGYLLHLSFMVHQSSKRKVGGLGNMERVLCHVRPWHPEPDTDMLVTISYVRGP